MTTDTYFEELAEALRTAGVPAEQIASTVADLRAHLAETGTAAVEEFGPAAEFAAQLGGVVPPPGAPEEAAENWTWTADLFNDRRMLAIHGDQGWEVESLDSVGRFVCRRAPGQALRWEYRREVIRGRRKDQVLAELSPEGWELCGEWMVYGYFKRPKAASAGPAGALDTLPATPTQWLFLSRRGKALLGCWMLLSAAAALTLGLPGYVMLCMGLGALVSSVVTSRLETARGEVAAAAAARAADAAPTAPPKP
ncbi:hypothetical protein ACF09C_16685 [Streptomyces sp. NPDC014870]|uniref:hypothetical protein n=1 Tax=Streptomyces sp. NPDC014870 TaxID=3364925 RepID=UPI0036FBC9F8